MKISECLGVNLRTVPRIQKELDDSNVDYVGRVGWKIYFGYSDKKRNPEFVGKILAIIDKSARFIALNTRVSEFFIRQVVHENIQYFSNKMRKDQFLSQTIKDKKKDRAAKLLNELKHWL